MSAPILPGENADLFPDEIPASGFVFDHSPGAVAQRFVLLEALRVSPVDTFTARDDLGILMPAARVHELRALEYSIMRDLIDKPDARGVMRFGIALYTLIGEPDAGAK
jgi:hypothetical protein